MTKQKCIIVAYPMGRTGSSMLMGLLSKHGVYAGDSESFVGAEAMNPKGFYEFKDQDETLSRIFKGVYPDKVNPPSIDWTFKRAGKFKRRYKRYLKKHFGDKTFVMKSPRCLSLALFHSLNQHFDITVVYLTRNKDDQIKSLVKVNNEDELFFKSYIENWSEFSENLLDKLNFKIVMADFNQMINQPSETLSRIFDTASLNIQPKQHLIDEWIDVKLVNRDENV